MRWNKERQRQFNVVLMNITGVLTWYLLRSYLTDGRLWLATLPVILVFLNGIAFVAIMIRRLIGRRHDSSNT